MDDLVGDSGKKDFSSCFETGQRAKATAKAKCGGLSTARRTMKLPVASVEVTHFEGARRCFGGAKMTHSRWSKSDHFW
jgi:hypothetical protein